MKESGKTSKLRIEWIDRAKGLGILLVMLGHTYIDGKYTFWFYSFHMTLFFFLSGVTFSAGGSYISFLEKKIRSLLVPYCFFAFVTILCNGVLAITHGHTYDFKEIVILYLIQKRYTLLWFIACLFIVEQIMWFISLYIVKEKKYMWIFISLIGLACFGIYRRFIGIDLPWNADLAILATAVMSLGKAYVVFYGVNKEDKCLKGIAVGIIWIVASWLNYNYFGKTDWFSNEFGNPLIFIIAAVSGTLFTVIICKHLKSFLLEQIGANSLVFYGLHRLVIDNLLVICGKFGLSFSNDSISYLILAVGVIVLCIMVLIPVNFILINYFPGVLGRRKTKND